MEEEHSKLLQLNRTRLVDNISCHPAVCDYLFEKGIFTKDHKQEVEAKNTPNNSVRHILDILPTRGPTAFDTFHECLLVTQNTTAANILKPHLQHIHPTTGACQEDISSEEWEILKMLQGDLIIYYRKRFSQLPISPIFEEDGYASKFSDLYVKPILSQHRPKRRSKLTTVTTLQDIFAGNSETFQNIYISSPAGCGKTSFLKYMALIWCQAHLPVASDNQWMLEEEVNEMRKFVLLFFVYLRESHDKECEVVRMIQDQLLCRLGKSYKYENSLLLLKLLGNVKCIILLDGLDEWNHPLQTQCNDKHIPHFRDTPLCTKVTTSRPWKLDVVRLKPEEIDRKLELKGLEGELLEELIKRVVKQMNNLSEKNKNAKLFKIQLRCNKLLALSKIPVLLMQLLTLWNDDKPFGKSQCEIYTNMVELLLERHFRKSKDCLENEKRNIEGCTSEQQIPLCLQSSVHCKTHVDLLSKLGELAFDTLFNVTQESSLVFDVTVVNKYLTDNDLHMCLKVGILTQEKVTGVLSERRSNVSFLHKSFQEFLTAFYVTINPGKRMDIIEKIKTVCCSIEKIFEMSQIFMFLSGLCPDVVSHLFQHLTDTVSADRRTKDYRSMCKLGPMSSEGWILRQVQDTLMEWSTECLLNGNTKAFKLSVIDLFIGPPSHWSDEVKYLTVCNPVSSLYVGYVSWYHKYTPEIIEDILSSVTKFNSIQKLYLMMVSEYFVNQLVSLNKNSWSLKPESWRNLKCVTLDDPNMSSDNLCSLVDSILQLPKSVRVRLVEYRIRQGIRDWRPYVRSNPSITVDIDDAHVDDRRKVKLLQFHTNKV